MGALGIACGLYLSLGSLGESDTEQSKDISIAGLSLNVTFNKGVPFFNHGACLISGNVHTMEVGVTIESFNLIDLELQLSPCLTL